MSQTIGLDGGPHEKMLKLLPWYAMGKLDAEEAAQFESHLADCVECRTELQSERALGRQIADLSVEVERGWAALRTHIKLAHDGAPSESLVTRPTTRWPRAMSWLLSAQAAAIVVLGLIIAIPQFDRAPQYQALGASPTMNTGNMIVVFRPETPERELRRMLHDSGARLVDGPTSADAYVLRVADAGRGAALAQLRAEADVVLAEPIDAGGQQ